MVVVADRGVVIVINAVSLTGRVSWMVAISNLGNCMVSNMLFVSGFVFDIVSNAVCIAASVAGTVMVSGLNPIPVRGAAMDTENAGVMKEGAIVGLVIGARGAGLVSGFSLIPVRGAVMDTENAGVMKDVAIVGLVIGAEGATICGFWIWIGYPA